MEACTQSDKGHMAIACRVNKPWFLAYATFVAVVGMRVTIPKVKVPARTIVHATTSGHVATTVGSKIGSPEVTLRHARLYTLASLDDDGRTLKPNFKR